MITGASGGIGSELARAFAGPGVSLALIARDAQRLEPLARECEAAGATVALAGIDVRDRAGLHAFLQAHDTDHPVDLLISNAGVTCGLGAGRSRETDEDAEWLAEVNYKGAVHTVSALVERMRARRAGRIVLMSSLAGMRGFPDMPSYSATKAALIAYGESLGGWLRRDRVGVTVICPGFVTSPMSARYMGAKPFEISAAKAAQIIKQAAEKGKPFRAFPLPLALGIRLSKFLPAWASDLCYAPMSADVARDPRSDL
ncbi:SDR family NAD(P)-dependent oxidoreductase [Breoghania sp.]|uniref:SDR family NAD(P)-dependent oxidoreductase n=1 Tax=Breoghania sp. TaxID=2065378 RepID=UPI002618E9A9|nr:SDR family NAD(P)-dependent oxidoreductase [Breoghania sp.]MDJ0932165.1 SDR family NAD(P)-dependent oxidoreductase [Breoghania sp.]